MSERNGKKGKKYYNERMILFETVYNQKYVKKIDKETKNWKNKSVH
jgi:hypothetical protein